ncbi:SusC/RagA family TonB-linked outer membrane protein [Larkinella terrae]|uniref:SusC/RagA family TonB-linked outer membrane protein n=1 Tax=Larkinella terrae TaxID=2025311 RepID=A0A7K0EMY7_9BACT|nr:SusC/RagA family TonB-linked outer membrane protein [Larkinella terrae]MRS63187.1 SusC/RagA family TonB-linked outer membrane protein [Larkinella terrae]
MKKILLFLWGVILVGTIPTNAQLIASNGHRIKLQEKDLAAPVVTLKAALSELEKQYRVSFIYRTDLVDTKVVLTGHRDRTVEEALTNLLSDKGLTFEKIQANFYVIVATKEKGTRFFRKINQIEKKAFEPQVGSEPVTSADLNVIKLERIGYSVLSADKPMDDIRGKVSGAGGDGLPGVSVVIKGSTRGTTTNGEGEFSINAPGDATLVFSFVGFASKEVPINGRTNLTVTLVEDERALEEVVVVGYGTQKRASVTGAVSSVTPKDLTALPVISAESAMQGRVPGVRVVNNGSPGQSPIVRIRGVGSINYASGPLYVIDGVPSGDLNNLDPKDIESLEVLKDASAAAIYGSRASNGVVIISTKKGTKDGKLHVNFDTYFGTQTAWKKLDLLNTQEYIQYATALLGNAKIAMPARLSNLNTPIYDGASQTFAQTATDWQDVMLRTAPIQQHQISVSGGNAVSRFFTSAGYFDQEGILIGTNYKRGNVRINSDHQITKFLTFGQTLMISYDKMRGEQGFGGGRTAIMQAIRNLPYWPVSDPTKAGGYSSPTAADGSDPDNPVRIALQDRSYNQRVKLLGTLFTEIKFTNFLKYRFSFGADIVTAIGTNLFPIYNDGYKSRTQDNIQDNRTSYYSPILTNQLTYDQTFGKHYINATVVAEKQTFRSSSLNGNGFRPNNDIDVLQGISNPGVTSSKDESALISYIGRVNYEFAGKYLISGSVRRDGSSRFAPGNKWGTFPSASVGWRVSEESFMKSVPNLSELKIRGSIGQTGFNGIGSYAWQSLISADNTNYVFGANKVLGSYFASLGNTALKWETTTMSNVGVDLGLFSNKLTFTAEVYNRKTDGLLLNVPIPNSIGYASPPLANIGSMKNWGYEFQAGYSHNEGDFRWNLSANMDITRNKVTSLATPSATLYSGLNQDFGGFDITKTEAGQAIQSFYGWQVEGIYQSLDDVFNSPRAQNRAETREAHDPTKNTSPGDIKFKDVNGDGKITDADRTYLGSYIPKFSYGVNFSANYKNFDVTVYLQGVYGNKIYNGTKVIEEGMLRLFNAGKGVLNAWTPTNTGTDVPRAVSGDPNNNSRTSDRFIEDGSYMRVKNFTIGYNIPAPVLGKFTRNTLTKARLYVSSTNLLTFTKYTGLDPEIGINGTAGDNTKLLTNGIDYGQYPQPRTLLIGLNIGF